MMIFLFVFSCWSPRLHISSLLFRDLFIPIHNLLCQMLNTAIRCMGVLNSFLGGLVHSQTLHHLQQVDDDHVGTKLETELWEGGSHCLAQVKIIPVGQK